MAANETTHVITTTDGITRVITAASKVAAERKAIRRAGRDRHGRRHRITESFAVAV